jgi:hypothetical protein
MRKSLPITVCFVLLGFVVMFWPGNRRFNCHGFAWQNGEQYTPWSELEEFSRAAPVDNPAAGDIIVYGGGSHSAVYLGRGVAISKMGSLLILVHPVNWVYCCYGPVSGFYRKG